MLLVGERKFYGHGRRRTTLIKSERCYWMTASIYRKYNRFSDRESEQQHRTRFGRLLANSSHVRSDVRYRARTHDLSGRRTSLRRLKLPKPPNASLTPSYKQGSTIRVLTSYMYVPEVRQHHGVVLLYFQLSTT